MENRFLKGLVLQSKQRGALLVLVCLLSLAITPGSAQSPKRITAMQLGETVDGSRVTIVSDSALTDYEAFRRGDRFYVKIPLAELKSGPPRCCAIGFSDVQVQRVGDSVIVSFKLMPGATARVDQRSNRLDVIFSAPGRTLRSNTANAGSPRGAIGIREPGTSSVRGPDAAGPMPPGSANVFRQRGLTEGERVANETRAQQNLRQQPNSRPNSNSSPNSQPTTGSNQAGAGKNQSTTGNSGIESPSPGSSSSSILSPSTPASPSLTAATPAESVSSQSAVSSSSSSGSPVSSGWKSRGKAALQWVAANRLATLLGALILLSLIVYLAVALLRRPRRWTSAKRGKAFKAQPKVQPKYSLESEFDELLSRGPVTPPASSNLQNELTKKPATAPAVVVTTPPNRSRVLTKPSIASPSASRERSSDDEEREVFEL
ncbi:MAG TPA: hypothetical protein VIF64_08330 [Pyrinomonadaceae bacterium]